MNPRMREALERAVEERAAAEGLASFSDRLRELGFTPGRVFQRSLDIGAEGFQRSTLWRALEIATEEGTTDAPR